MLPLTDKKKKIVNMWLWCSIINFLLLLLLLLLCIYVNYRAFLNIYKW